MNANERILLIFDAAGPTTIDQDFSEDFKKPEWKTERDVIKALKKLDANFQILGIYNDTDLIIDKVKQYQPTVIFNLVEAFNSDSKKDSHMASFFELLGIPHTGCGPIGLTLSKDKGLSKQILSYHRIKIPAFAKFKKGRKIRKSKRLKFPAIVKPIGEEASYGISQASLVDNYEQLQERAQFIFDSMNCDIIAEEYIDGREFCVSLLGESRIEVFPIREIKFSEVPEGEPRIATFSAKWDENYRKKWGIRNQFTGTLPNGLEARIKKVSKKIYQLLSLNGYARLDLRVANDGTIYFIEANPNPILDEWEDFAESAVKSGYTYPQLIEKIISLAKL